MEEGKGKKSGKGVMVDRRKTRGGEGGEEGGCWFHGFV